MEAVVHARGVDRLSKALRGPEQDLGQLASRSCFGVPHNPTVTQLLRDCPTRRTPGTDSAEASLRLRPGVAAETAVRERDRSDGGDAVRTPRTVRCRGGGNHDADEDADQDESKQSCRSSPR